MLSRCTFAFLLFFFFFAKKFDFSTNSQPHVGPVYCLWTHKFHFSSIFSLKIDLAVLFTYLKIILLQCFSVFYFQSYPNGPVVVVVAGPFGGVCLPPSPPQYEDFPIYQIEFEGQMDCVILYLLDVLWSNKKMNWNNNLIKNKKRKKKKKKMQIKHQDSKKTKVYYV